MRIRVMCLTTLAVRGLLAQPHPLDPLSKEEITATVAVLKSAGRITQNSRFPLVVLHEPAKSQPSATNRRAFAIIFERELNRTFETVVDLKTKGIVSWKEIHGVQAPIMGEDIELTEKIVRADSGWRQAMRKRGISDFSKIQIDPWTAGYHALPDDNGHRSVRAISYYRGDARSACMRPIEGVVAYVDLTARKVFKLVDRPLPKQNPDLNLQPRQQLKPLSISQPEGASFRSKGNEISWANWRFRFAIHPREGLVLYTVAYNDRGTLRSVLYRASLAEMVVPYGDPDVAWYFRNVFDTGEYAFVARSIAPLTPGADVPSNAVFYNAVFAGENGKPYDSTRAVAATKGMAACSGGIPTRRRPGPNRGGRGNWSCAISCRPAITSTDSTGSFIRMARSSSSACSLGSCRQRVLPPGIIRVTLIWWRRMWPPFTTSIFSISVLTSMWTAPRTASPS